MIQAILAGIGLVSNYMQSKAEEKKLKLQQQNAIEQKKLDRIQQLDNNDADWDRIMAQGSVDSWKDEFWTVVLAIPAIMAFIPGMDIYIKAGFDALSNTPDWYKAALLTAVAASFGMRQLAKWKIK